MREKESLRTFLFFQIKERTSFKLQTIACNISEITIILNRKSERKSEEKEHFN